MKKMVWLTVALLVALVFVSYKYVQILEKDIPVRNISYDVETGSVKLIESKHNKESFNLDVKVGYSNPQMFSEDFSHDKRFLSTMVLEEIPKIYIFDFQTKTRVEVESAFYDKVINEFSNGAMGYGFFWHPKENVLMVSLGGMYYPTKLYLFQIDESKTRLQFMKEIVFKEVVDLNTYGWIETSDINNEGFVVRVIKKYENLPGSGASKIADSYFEVIDKDGAVRSNKIY